MNDSILGIPDPESPPDFTVVMIAELEHEGGEEELCVVVSKYHGDDVSEVCELALSELGVHLGESNSSVLDLFVAAVFAGDVETILPEEEVEDIDLLAKC